MEELEQAQSASLSIDKTHSSPVRTDTTDFIIDMNSIAKQKSYAGQFSNDLILDPLNGGRWIEQVNLEIGDLILYNTINPSFEDDPNTTKKTISLAAVYIGSGKIIKLVESKIKETDLASIVDSEKIAAVLRHQLITPSKSGILRDLLIKKSKLAERSNRFVKIKKLRVQISPTVCASLNPTAKIKCNNFTGRIQLGTANNDEYFINNDFLEIYKNADMSITNIDPKWNSLDEIISLQYNNSLRYIGHFKQTPIKQN